jgi:nucleotide-binding universal stress UspA family protein
MAVVLAPVDGSERALRTVPWAAKLADSGGTVVLLRVIPPQPAYAEPLLRLAGGGEESVNRIEDAWQATAQADLAAAAETVTEPGVAVERMVAAGEPDEEIVAAANRRGADMIAMGSHGRGAVGRAIFGSVADRVARSAQVPVFILRTADEAPNGAVTISRLVVPLDGSPIAERALPVATEIAKRLSVPVHVVRAVDATTAVPVALSVFGPSPMVTADITEQLWREVEAEAKKTVADAIARLKDEGFEATGATLNGSPFFAISAATKPGDVIILTSHGRGGVRRWLLGSVAEKLVREAPVPVLLVPAPERDKEGDGEGDGMLG